jgi:TonB family protein
MSNHGKIGKRTLVILTIVIACGGALSARADQVWGKEMQRSAASLQAGKYAVSLKIADQLISNMVERLGEGDDEMFATALVHKALANAGLGNVDDALWYWYIAQEISPNLAKSDLSAFGAPAEFLTRHPLSTADVAMGVGVAPATVLEQVKPKFPAGASRFGIAGDLAVQVVIDGKGQPTLPKIVHALPAPTLSFVALEALRHWRFKPATHNGEPVSSVFNLKVHYKL